MKTVVEILSFSSGTRVVAGMFDGLKEGSRLFGRLLGIVVGENMRIFLRYAQAGYSAVGQRNRKFNNKFI